LGRACGGRAVGGLGFLEEGEQEVVGGLDRERVGGRVGGEGL